MRSIVAHSRPDTTGTWLRLAWGCILAVSLIPYAMADNQLLNVKYHTIIDHQLEMELVFAEPIVEPKISLDANPAGIRLVFADTSSKLDKSELPINQVGVTEMTTQQQDRALQVALTLKKVKPYQGKVIGNTYRLTINDEVMDPKAKDSNPFVNKIKNIDFHRSGSNGGELVVDLSNASVAANVEQVGAKLEVKFFNTEIPDDMLYVMDVQDFATPVSSFETFRDDMTTRFMIDVKGMYDYSYQQEGNQFKVVMTKAEKAASIEPKKKYSGKNISLNFQKISVRTALQIIADYNNFNLVTSDTVEGSITLRLDDVPWDQALDLILQTKGLDKRIEGNILMVAPAEEIAIRESQTLKNKQEVAQLAPLYSEYLQINYAKATDIATLLKGEGSSLLSERGSVAVDERTNTLLVKDTADILENVHRLIDALDIPIKQVLIESRMVTVSDTVAQDLGVRWGVTDLQGDYGTSGSLEGSSGLVSGGTPDLADRLNVNLPAGASNAASIAFSVAKLSDGTLLDLELSALEQENKGEIIASPRITTSNQKAAYIEQGVEIPYVESASSGAATVQFKKAVLSLRVTPQITPDNKVILDLEITQDSQGETVQTPLGEAVSINTQKVGTQVLVDNGETIVLGGIYQQQVINSVNKVPVLGDIPVLGALFRNTSDSNERRELLIFVTPKIVTENL
ncbi:type IV pilus secretin PilQ family protein [Shewanella sp. C32]|uniref:Type IV pilus secretin PilQ family protein n=1 Tax=Shewanella electrica TaxID=515560 RepID=A0ABT2FR55_9GAMM|nr:type IV pilus secretin PilQ family protein [Shewanella electrica]MCH1926165.1 type IV pilus secretin PilQ family protein [Shewanella electrica]MCS4557671.1 type IV pilus secretin PilQ family protein [Shewanella electrica]